MDFRYDNSNLLKTALRELKEETGIELDKGTSPLAQVTMDRHTYFVLKTEGTPEVSLATKEVDAYDWLSLDEIKKSLFKFNRPIKQLIKNEHKLEVVSSAIVDSAIAGAIEAY
jgi:8-oxo-dGTP pyrophosphatase MutT (NUDIX family)